MEIPSNLGPSGITDRIAAIHHEMSVRLGIPEPGSFAKHLDRASSTNSASSDQAPADLRPLIDKAANDYNIDPDLLDCLVHQESGYNTNSRSGVGAMGLTQLMPGTASGLGVTNPYDPEQNLMGGAKYLRQQLDRFGNVPEALAAYNAGPGAVIRYGGIPHFAETQNYVKTIMARYDRLKSGSADSVQVAK